MDCDFEVKVAGTGNEINCSYDGSGKELLVSVEVAAAKIIAKIEKSKADMDKLRSDMNAIVETLAADAWAEEVAETNEEKSEAKARFDYFVSMLMK